MHCAVIIPVDPENTQPADEAAYSVQFAAETGCGPFDNIFIIRISVAADDLRGRAAAYGQAIRQAGENGIQWLFFLDRGDIVHPCAFQSVLAAIERHDAIFGLLSEQDMSGQGVIQEPVQVRAMSRFEDLLCNDPDLTLQCGHLLRSEVALMSDMAESIAGGEDLVYYLRLWSRFRCCKLDKTLNVRRVRASRERQDAHTVDEIGGRHRQLLDSCALLLAGSGGAVKVPDTEVLFRQIQRMQQQGYASLPEALFLLVLQYDALPYNRAYALNQLKRQNEAFEYLRQVLADNPLSVPAWSLMGTLLQEIGYHQEALNCFERGLALEPDSPELLFNRSVSLRKLKRYEEALQSCDQALALRTDFVSALYIRGAIFNDIGRQDKALESFSRVLKLNPDSEMAAKALHDSGMALRFRGLLKDALKCYERELTLKTRYCLYTKGERLYCRQLMCDWLDFEAIGTNILQDIDAGAPVSTPMAIFALPSTRRQQRRCAEMYRASFGRRETAEAMPGYRHDKIRIGYFSADFYSHPVAYLTAELFELHDRARFEVIAFSLGPLSQDSIRRRLERGFDRFIDVRGQSDQEISELAHALEIDMAIDLSGYSQDARPGLFARRMAPVQAHYLGFAGTMGDNFMDYLIADPVVVAEDHLPDYAEKIVFLPDSFMVSDRQRQIDPRPFTRAEAGLPENVFVYCAFNNPNKITPQVFEIWMSILREVENSVLWLSARNEWCVPNLRQEAARRGVCADRLIFAPRMEESARHLARQRAADLFLDTLYYGAHTTANDALWAGLPVLTCLGETFAGRVAASLLSAIDLPELIANTQEAYRLRAIELARDPEQLNTIKNKLAMNRATAPLFDTPRFTRYLEAAYIEMWRRQQMGLAPDHIHVQAMGAV
ncbi:tetratricopeptide repeat protein [Candidatus Methylospira mobilis]|uniref:O-linked N-acetylglucosamine transferase, SPINDLY family protein n=1 Tax=Candidatus Methylospira mobilis TaxID=1808979 RepID=UPI0028E6A240|nr:tetratricopeptide repeat protein [Candidatus Methylospira mobilis]WNV06763.1 tetratricopeptide repeat protein [Candidatus Methylospira mobilis]